MADVPAVSSLDAAPRDPVPPHVPSAEEVRAELDRILSSPPFHAGDRRSAFLRFIVEETLAGRADRLKGYTIAVEVFGRDEAFDAQADPVVRLEARRLRRDLDSYYVDAGSHDGVRISIPKGSYVPRFERHEMAEPVAMSEGPLANEVSGAGVSDIWSRIAKIGGRPVLLIAAAVAGVAAAAAGWVMTAEKTGSAAVDTAQGPAVVVMPFEALGATENSRYLAEGIGQELIDNLMRFPGFRLYNLPAGIGEDAGVAPVALGRDLGVAYVVSGSVRDDPGEVRVAAQMIDAATGQVLWTGSYDRPLNPNALIGVESDLAGEIAAVLGQPYGVVANDLATRLATPAVSSMQSYVCVLRAYGYRRGFSPEELDPVLGCLEEAVQREPQYAEAWAMLGWLHMDAGRTGYGGDDKRQEEYDKALQAASRAVELEPNNILALKALAAINHYIERYDESVRLARQAAELNPHDPETLAQLGWRLAVRGNFEEGIPLLKRAIERTVNPPGWYFHLVAIDLFLKGQYEEMLDVAERSASGGRGVSQALIAIAAAELGEPGMARQALAKMSEHESLARDPAAYLRRHGAIDEIVDELVAGLQKARQVASAS